MKGISTSKKNLCPVCGNHHGCKIQEDKRVLCLRGSSQQDAPPGYRFIKPLRNGMGGLFGINNSAHSDGTWQDSIDRINQRRQREREATARLLGTEELGIEERDRQYQAVMTQLGLSQQHSQTLLERGLTQAEIEQAGLRSWEPGKRVTDATSQLAGIDSKGDRLVGARGIFIPAYDSWGNITGAQLKTDSNRPGKYIWLSSYKEDGTGNGPHLPGGELPLFVWRHSEAQQVSLVILCEGALKSAIAAFLLWRIGLTDIAVIGAAAAGFFGSDTLKAYLEQLAPLRVQLAPDAGAINNTSNIPAANQQTIKQCQGWGFSVDILWWRQTYKNQHLDIDELLAAGRWGEVQAISPDEFFHLHPVATREKLENHTPQSTGNSEHRANEPDANAYSQYLKLEDEQKRVERVEQEVRGFGKVKQFLKRLLPKRLPFELPPPKKLPEVLRYAPGNLPWYGKVENYPKILYTPEQLPQLLTEAREKEWQDILDSSGTGIGKSHRYATLSPFTLGIEDKGRAWLLSQSHRNPTTAPAKHNYSDMPVRVRTGFVEDPDRKTATGSPYKRYPTEKEARSLHNGNCHMADLIHSVAAKGIKDAKEEAQYNPFCTYFCSHKDYCGKFTGPGFGYRYERRQLFENNYQIGSSIESLSEPSNYPYERDVAILDEPLQQLKPVQVIKANTTDLATQWDELNYQLPQVADELAPLRTALASLVRRVDLPYQGLNHEQLLALLPPVLEDFTDTLERIRVAMAVDLETLAGDAPDTASTQEEGERVTSLKAKIKQRLEKLAKFQTELIELQNIEDELLRTAQQL